MNVLDRIKCLIGRHDRSRSRAVRYVDNSVLSVCRHCGKAMFRHPREGWMVERRAEQRSFEKAGRLRKPGEGGDDDAEIDEAGDDD